VPGTQSYRTGLCEATTSGLPPKDIRHMGLDVRLVPILLQKSQIAERQFSRQKTRHDVIAD
jgi:hypothetical protein